MYLLSTPIFVGHYFHTFSTFRSNGIRRGTRLLTKDYLLED